MDVKLCQRQIIKLDLQIKALIQDVQRCEGPLQALEEMNLNVAELISELKRKLEELERLAMEQDKETSRAALTKEAADYRKVLNSTQVSLRKANLTCQLAMERREKDELLHGGTEIRKRVQSNKDALVTTSSNVTESLMSLNRLMTNQMKQSEETMGSLVSSSGEIGETKEEFKNMSGHIESSRKLLTKYGRRECTDKILIFFALVFFFACVLYIIKKRLLGASEEVYEVPASSS